MNALEKLCPEADSYFPSSGFEELTARLDRLTAGGPGIINGRTLVDREDAAAIAAGCLITLLAESAQAEPTPGTGKMNVPLEEYLHNLRADVLGMLPRDDSMFIGLASAEPDAEPLEEPAVGPIETIEETQTEEEPIT